MNNEAFYDVDPQTGKFIGVARAAAEISDLRVRIVPNWLGELRARVPVE